MIYILLPAYNEAKNIGKVLARLEEIPLLREKSFQVVVVDDGSRDGTAEVVKAHQPQEPIRLITFEQNCGVGEVFYQGFHAICRDSRQPENDICIALDSDNTQDPLLIVPLVQKITENFDIVIASRFAPGGGMVGCPLWRQLLSLIASWTLRLTVGLPQVKDYSTFYRAYRVSLIQQGLKHYDRQLLQGKGFSTIAGLLVKLSRFTNRIAEVPMVLRYDLKQGKSGMRLFLTTRGYLALILERLKTRGNSG